MLANYLKTAVRHLWRNRLYTALNVLGLAIGLSTCWIVYRLVSYEYAFDQQQPDKERIYRVVTKLQNNFMMPSMAGVPLPLLNAVRSQVAGVERVMAVREQWSESVYASRPGGKAERFSEVTNVVATDTNYFQLIPYQWLAGDLNRALARPKQVVLSQSRAERYFPGLLPQQVLDRTLTYFDTLVVQVAGVVADPVQPISFAGREFLSLVTLPAVTDNAEQWDNINSADQLYVWLAPNTNPEQIASRINNIAARHSKAAQLKNGHREREHRLQPLTDIHFGTEYVDSSRRANKGVLYQLMGLAGFILLLASINYVNLTTAQAPGRAREIGIRKTLGSQRRTIVAQFLGETVFVTGLALALAFVLARLFFTRFGDLLPDGTDAYIDWPLTVGFLAGLVILVSLLAGLYPGWLATRFQPVEVLRGQINLIPGTGSRGFTLRKGLIVFQFAMAQLFIIGAILLGQQMRYALSKDMGFDRDAVVLTRLPVTPNLETNVQKRYALRAGIAHLPGVAAVSLGNPPANRSVSTNEFTLRRGKKEAKVTIQFKYVDTNYVSLYKLPLLAGRNLEPTDTMRDLVINQTTVRALGFARPQEAIGQFLRTGDKTYPIVGVVRDFQVSSVRDKIAPVALVAYQRWSNNISIKLASPRPADWQGTLAQVRHVWAGLYPDEPFNYEFYDQTIAAFYKSEQTMTRIINLATGVAILISCLGLFGLATLTAFQRTKEIGVRKVLGASVGSVVTLLSKDFLKLVLIAILIASPLAGYAMNKWLQGFAYKITIEWWVFALAGLLAVGVALLTVSFQAVKAALMNPVKSLRSE